MQTAFNLEEIVAYVMSPGMFQYEMVIYTYTGFGHDKTPEEGTKCPIRTSVMLMPLTNQNSQTSLSQLCALPFLPFAPDRNTKRDSCLHHPAWTCLIHHRARKPTKLQLSTPDSVDPSIKKSIDQQSPWKTPHLRVNKIVIL